MNFLEPLFQGFIPVKRKLDESLKFIRKINQKYFMVTANAAITGVFQAAFFVTKFAQKITKKTA